VHGDHQSTAEVNATQHRAVSLRQLISFCSFSRESRLLRNKHSLQWVALRNQFQCLNCGEY